MPDPDAVPDDGADLRLQEESRWDRRLSPRLYSATDSLTISLLPTAFTRSVCRIV